MRQVHERLVAQVRAHRMWGPGDTVRVAVSGGRDSVVLLHALIATQGLHGAELEVMSVDHGTRQDSAADADWAADLAREWGVPARRVSLALGSDASEATCRDARRRVLLQGEPAAIALGHHARDLVETLLMRLMRGTGPRGLPGMVPWSDPWARPLLDVPYDDVVAYASAHGLSWREDPSNTSSRYLRNRVRSELLPLMEDLRTGSLGSMARTAELLGEQSQWLDEMATERAAGDPWDTTFLATAPLPLVRHAVSKAEPGLGHRHIDALRRLAERGTGQLQLPGGRLAIAEAGRVRTCTLQDSPSTGGACDT